MFPAVHLISAVSAVLCLTSLILEVAVCFVKIRTVSFVQPITFVRVAFSVVSYLTTSESALYVQLITVLPVQQKITVMSARQTTLFSIINVCFV